MFRFEYLNNYANHGQNAEQSIRYHFTGKIEKADNLPHNLGGDMGDYQIKSARATVCKGTDVKSYLDNDGAKAYIYGTNDGIGYIMNRPTYEKFIGLFGTITRESKKNGGAEKIRLKSESKAMLEWLEALN